MGYDMEPILADAEKHGWDMSARPVSQQEPSFKPLSPLSEIEHRMGLQPLAELHAERDVLVKKVANLRARYGSFGTYDDLRKIKLAAIAQLIRAKAVKQEKKLTAAEVDDAAHCHSAYVDFVITSTRERAEWTVLENGIQSVDETIFRQQAIARFLANEVRLDR